MPWYNHAPPKLTISVQAKEEKKVILYDANDKPLTTPFIGFVPKEKPEKD